MRLIFVMDSFSFSIKGWLDKFWIANIAIEDDWQFFLCYFFRKCTTLWCKGWLLGKFFVFIKLLALLILLKYPEIKSKIKFKILSRFSVRSTVKTLSNSNPKFQVTLLSSKMRLNNIYNVLYNVTVVRVYFFGSDALPPFRLDSWDMTLQKVYAVK